MVVVVCARCPATDWETACSLDKRCPVHRSSITHEPQVSNPPILVLGSYSKLCQQARIGLDQDAQQYFKCFYSIS
jgi:hypothetical protein